MSTAKLKSIHLRVARKSDLDALEALENQSFNYDRLSRKSFQWMLTKAHAILLVATQDKALIGYGLVLLNTGTRLARLYSIAVAKTHRGLGLGNTILETLIDKAEEEDFVYLRLEVKPDNKQAIGLYEKMGFRLLNRKKEYYSDGSDALCFEKRIKYLKPSPKFSVPYYQQTLDFTCGPACLMMGIKKFKPQYKLSLHEELKIWREATTIFMTSGHGGCGPRGLALSAVDRGIRPVLYLSHTGVLFEDTVRSAEKKNVLTVVNDSFTAELRKKKVKVNHKRITLDEIQSILNRGGVVLVLITTYHFDRRKVPHWVLITAMDESFVYFHDPDRSEVEKHEARVDRLNVPVSHKQFRKMFKFGRQKMMLALALYKK